MQPEGQIERLAQVLDIFELKAQGKTCDAILSIMKEGQEMVDEHRAPCAPPPAFWPQDLGKAAGSPDATR